MLEGKRVLVVEDEPIVAMMLEDLLEDLGAVIVGPASTIARASELIGEGPVDIAILDINLGGEHSHPIAAELRSRTVPFIFATGHGSTGLADLGEVPFVPKPYRPDQITVALQRALSDAV